MLVLQIRKSKNQVVTRKNYEWDKEQYKQAKIDHTELAWVHISNMFIFLPSNQKLTFLNLES